MNRHFGRIFIVLAASVAIIILIGISALTTEAGGGGPTPVLNWTVNWGQKEYATGPSAPWVTYWLAKSSQPMTLNANAYYRHIYLPGGPEKVGIDTNSKKYTADPANLYVPMGFQLGYEGTSSFAGTFWYSDTCLPGPSISFAVSSPNTSWTKVKVLVVNTTNTMLFASPDGWSWQEIPVGDWYSTAETTVTGQLLLHTEPNGNVGKRCADAFFFPKIATPSLTPSPTATPSPTPTPTPKDVIFNLNPSTSTISLGETVDMALKIDTQGQKVDGIEAVVKYDSAALQVGSVADGNCDLLPTLLAQKTDETVGTVHVARGRNFVGEGPVDVGNCTLAFINFVAVGPPGQTDISFVLPPEFPATRVATEGEYLPLTVTNSVVTVTDE